MKSQCIESNSFIQLTQAIKLGAVLLFHISFTSHVLSVSNFCRSYFNCLSYSFPWSDVIAAVLFLRNLLPVITSVLWLPKGLLGSLSQSSWSIFYKSTREILLRLIWSCLLNIYLCLLIVFLVWLCPTPLASSLTTSSILTHFKTICKPFFFFLSTMAPLGTAYAVSFDWTTLPFFICLLHSDSFSRLSESLLFGNLFLC